MIVNLSKILFQSDYITNHLKKASYSHVLQDCFFLLKYHEESPVTIACKKIYYIVCFWSPLLALSSVPAWLTSFLRIYGGSRQHIPSVLVTIVSSLYC